MTAIERIVAAILAAFLVFILWALQLEAVQSAVFVYPRRVRCQANLLQIGLALRQYHDDYGSFPPAFVADEQGRPIHSWRALLLPYLPQWLPDDSYHFDEPWDGPTNINLCKQPSPPFFCSSRYGLKDPQVSYFAVVGPNTAWPGSRPARLSKDFLDGADKTILVVEAIDADAQWSEPRDLQFDQMTFQLNSSKGKSISSRHRHVNVLFADGHVEDLPETTAPDVIRAMLTANGGEAFDLKSGKP